MYKDQDLRENIKQKGVEKKTDLEESDDFYEISLVRQSLLITIQLENM